MSLVRQLWLAVIMITLISFTGSFFVSLFSVRNHLEQQLDRKNIDAANSLALSLSQLTKDPATIELQAASVFDSGHYALVSLVAPDGKTLLEKKQDHTDAGIPDWFTSLFPVRTQTGRAQVSDGWSQYGIVQVTSHTRFAHQTLWEQAGTMCLWFLAAGTLAGLAGMLILRGISQPLTEMVRQAEAINERRFLTISEPAISELRSVARATNDMVRRLHNRFIEEAIRLDKLRQQINHDAITGLANRDYFLSRIGTVLDDDNAAASGTLLIIRLHDLGEINQKLGHVSTNNLLRQVGQLLENITHENPGRLAARLNGADFILILPDTDDTTQQLADQLSGELITLGQHIDSRILDFFHIGIIRYQRGDSIGALLASADTALATAEGAGANAWHTITAHPRQLAVATNAEDWRHIFADASGENRLKLLLYPVYDNQGKTLHQEGVIRLQTSQQGEWLAAGHFMAMAARFDMTGLLDLHVVRHAITLLESGTDQIAINFSIKTITNWGFRNDITELLRKYPGLCQRLWVEVPEYGVFREFEAFRDFSYSFKELGCRVGIEHFGHYFSEVQKFTDLGLDYVKTDASFTGDIDKHPGNQTFLQGVCNLAHSIGIIVIATGVQNPAEHGTLIRLGFDGATGPGVTANSNHGNIISTAS